MLKLTKMIWSIIALLLLFCFGILIAEREQLTFERIYSLFLDGINITRMWIVDSFFNLKYFIQQIECVLKLGH